jgi:polyisoprenoid-binding protein YceI
MKTRKIALAATAAVVLASPAARAQTEAYTIDPVHSSVSFKIRHMMVTDVKGTFDKISGTIHLDAKNVAASSVEVSIETASVNTRNERRDGDLRSANFFEAEKHPTITFKSKKITKQGEQWVAIGDLTMRGVTKEIQLPFTLSGPVAAGESSLIGVSAETKINRQDFGVSWNKTLDAGGLVVGDTVVIELEVEARK